MSHKYKDKYVSIKDIYKSIRTSFGKYFLYCKKRDRKLYKSVDYGIYYNIIKRFCEILIRDTAIRDRKVYLPNQMGYIYLGERPHKRAFHYRIDNEATKEAGQTVRYRVPILDDFYKKLIWVRPTKYRNCKIMPLGYSKRIINKN
jgi:hypothetical protein